MNKTVDRIMKLEEKLRTEKKIKEGFKLARIIGILYTKVKPCSRCKGTGMVDKEKERGKGMAKPRCKKCGSKRVVKRIGTKRRRSDAKQRYVSSKFWVCLKCDYYWEAKP